jgi:hypothetical protein
MFAETRPTDLGPTHRSSVGRTQLRPYQHNSETTQRSHDTLPVGATTLAFTAFTYIFHTNYRVCIWTSTSNTGEHALIFETRTPRTSRVGRSLRVKRMWCRCSLPRTLDMILYDVHSQLGLK